MTASEVIEELKKNCDCSTFPAGCDCYWCRLRKRIERDGLTTTWEGSSLEEVPDEDEAQA